MVTDGRFFHRPSGVPRNTGNVFSVRPKDTVCTAFHSFALWNPAGEKDSTTTRHGDGKCLPRKVYNSRKEKLSTASYAVQFFPHSAGVVLLAEPYRNWTGAPGSPKR